MKALGTHLLLDLAQVTQSVLDDPDELERQLVDAAISGGAHVVETRFHCFEPQGVSGVVILAESHLALHTWPEIGFAAIDIFTCGEDAVAQAIAREIVDRFRPGDHEIRRLVRGPRAAIRAV